MSGNCATCRHWDESARDPATDREGGGFGVCKAVTHFQDVEDEAPYDTTIEDVSAAYKKNREETIAAYRRRKAFVEDGDSYWGALVTAPDFGCVLWAAA